MEGDHDRKSQILFQLVEGAAQVGESFVQIIRRAAIDQPVRMVPQRNVEIYSVRMVGEVIQNRRRQTGCGKVETGNVDDLCAPQLGYILDKMQAVSPPANTEQWRFYFQVVGANRHHLAKSKTGAA